VSATPVFSAHLTGTVLGTLRLWATPSGIRRLAFDYGPDVPGPGEVFSSGDAPTHLVAALAALRRYLEGRTRSLEAPLDLDPALSAFQRRVYDRLLRIPVGEVATYGRVAVDIGAEGPGAARAVGQAVGANPVPIFIPCHRVVGSDGKLTGFGGGTHRKAALLALEGIEVDGALASSRVHPEVLRLPL
jgi:methylated-DNA-[protein]-cysteine S-methyltransferase